MLKTEYVAYAESHPKMKMNFYLQESIQYLSKSLVSSWIMYHSLLSAEFSKKIRSQLHLPVTANNTYLGLSMLAL